MSTATATPDELEPRPGPVRAAGHYLEYTVETPASEVRGARRLVIGADGETFYTRDHYQSFIRINPEDFG